MGIMSRREAIFFSLSFIVAAADLILKCILSCLKPDIQVGAFLRIVVSHNNGAAFGILQGNSMLLGFFALLITGCALLFYDSIAKSEFLLPASLIFGGALGNMVERFFMGSVTDYLAFSFWPSFNLADSAVFIGTLWIILKLIKKK